MAELSTEAKFNLAAFSMDVATKDEATAKAELKTMYRELLLMDSRYKDAIRKSWGL